MRVLAKYPLWASGTKISCGKGGYIADTLLDRDMKN